MLHKYKSVTHWDSRGILRRKQMKFLIVAFFAVSLAGAIRGQVNGNPQQNDKEVLRQIEHEWGDAFLRKNVAELDRILADDGEGNILGAQETKRRLWPHFPPEATPSTP